MSDIKSYRIRTEVGENAPNVINVNLNQTYDILEILSLKLDQKNEYKYYESNYGVIVGRVLANGGFGIPNAKISIFIPVEDSETFQNRFIYNFTSVQDKDNNGVRYNTLPDYVDNACHQDVGAFPNKRLVLDNDDIIEMFDKYWKYTTTTNESGDYMIFGVPTGSQQLHADVDLSDIGVLSQRPRDMVYKGYNINLFDSPNKFKEDTNLNSLAQIYTQDKGVYVYSYWGETTNNGDSIAVTRCDIQIDYKFEPTCIFMGSVITDKGNNAINQGCNASTNNGRMSDLIAGEGRIEMIRKTQDNKVEQFQIKGDRLIDSDGVFCYQIPMNLDYVMTDEFGNIVPTDDPEKGIPTRTRVRFRFTLDETPTDGTARKRCSYLVPNNPRIDSENYPEFTDTLQVDYEFGTNTRDEDYRDLFWNNVYTVKNYIPKLQKNSSETNRKHTGIKWVNHAGDNNPMPFNGLTIKLGFMYRLICVLTKVIINLIEFLNQVISMLSMVICWIVNFLKSIECFKLPLIGKVCILRPIIRPIRKALEALIPSCIGLNSEFCDDGVNRITYYPGCGRMVFNLGKVPGDCVWSKTKTHHMNNEKNLPEEDKTDPQNSTAMLYTCVENQLAQDNDVTSFNFTNDWVNGVLYLPLWYRKITPKKSFLFGLFKRRAKDQWCRADKEYGNLRLYETCSLYKKTQDGASYINFNGEMINPLWGVDNGQGGESCHKEKADIKTMNGVIVVKDTMLGEKVYYYKPIEYDYSLPENTYGKQFRGNVTRGDIKLLFATDIVLLGSLNDCDLHGIPQFFKWLEPSTYNLPNDILDTDQTITITVDADGNPVETTLDSDTIETGCDWGNTNSEDQCGSPDGGLFYSIGCSTIKLQAKSCSNLSRICEFGVSKDVLKIVENLDELSSNDNSEGGKLIPDGYVSYDELYNLDQRAMFATMNCNNLKTKLNNTNGLREYDFRYLYPDNFDGGLKNIMQARQTNKCNKSYRYNYNLETFSRDYYQFRMGDYPYFYNVNGGKGRFPRYENSFYFYFGIKNGKTAIEKFNSQFFANCETIDGEYQSVGIKSVPNTWCSEMKSTGRDGYVEIDATGIETPYDIIINSKTNASVGYSIDGLIDEKIVICESDRFDELNVENYNYVNPENCRFNIPNGDYDVIVTDANGEISTFTFNANNVFLSFKNEKVDFNESNNILMNTHGSYDNIANEYKGNLEDRTINIGGTINVNTIVCNNKELENFKVTLYSEDIEYDYPYVIVKNGRVIDDDSGGSGLISITDSQNLTFGLPYGGVTYILTVTELCDDIDSYNSVTQKIFVDKVTPFKMYVNDVDYDLIKHWESGYNYNGVTNGKEPEQWLSMSIWGNYEWINSEEIMTICDNIMKNIAQYNAFYNGNKATLKDVVKIKNVLISENWIKQTEYENRGDEYICAIAVSIIGEFDIVFETDEEKEQLINETIEFLKQIVEYKINVISLMTSNFRITCNESSKTIVITAKSNSYPISYNMAGREETTSTNEEDDTVSNTLLNDVNKPEFWEGIYQVDDIMIPTITTQDSVKYGNKSYKVPGHDDKLCYATDNRSTFGNKLKFPYYCAIMNGNGLTLPEEVGKSNFPKDNDGYFIFHLVDKIFSFDMLVWSYINDIPYFKPEQEKVGKSINMNGLVAGLIMNGSVVSNDGGNVLFQEQMLGGDEILIKNFSTSSDYEDEMPTKRTIVGNNFNEYENYKILVDENNITVPPAQYASVPNKSVDFSITDASSCTITNSVYGNMKISLNDISVNDCKTGNKVLSVTIQNGGTDVKYFIFKHSDRPYPLNDISLDGIIDMSGNANNEWDGNTNGKIFSYVTTEKTFENLSSKDIRSQAPKEDNSIEMRNTDGWGTTGLFNIGDKSEAYYIVGVSENNCRTISPVYEFTDVIVDIIIVKETVINKGTGSGTGTGTGNGSVDIPTTGGGEDGGTEAQADDEESSETTSTDVSVDVNVDVNVDVEVPTVNYKFGVGFKDKNKIPYYFKYYSYDFDVYLMFGGNIIGGNITAEPIISVDEDGTIVENDGFIYYTITEDVYKGMVSTINPLIGGKVIAKATTVRAKDYVGLNHICKVNNDIEVKEITVESEETESEEGGETE